MLLRCIRVCFLLPLCVCCFLLLLFSIYAVFSDVVVFLLFLLLVYPSWLISV